MKNPNCKIPLSSPPKTFSALIAALILSIAAAAQNQPPVAEVRAATDEYFGRKIVDPYRWMEDLKADETQKWMRGQAKYAGNYLKSLPLREAILKRFDELNDSGIILYKVQKRGRRYFYYKQPPGANNLRLYARDGASGAERLLVAPEKFADAGKQAAIGDYRPSPDGRFVAVLIAKGGGEFGAVRVFDADKATETGDVIENTLWDAGYWLPDSRSFGYTKLPSLPPGAPENERERKITVYRHALGAKSETDAPVFGYGINPNLNLNPLFSPGVDFPIRGKYAVAQLGSGVSPNGEYYAAPMSEINQTPIPWRKIVSLEDEVSDVAQRGDYLYATTFKNTPRSKIVRVNLKNPDFKTAETVFPASDAIVKKMAIARDALYVGTLDGGAQKVYRVDYKTFTAREIKSPFVGSLYIRDASIERDGALLGVDAWTHSNAVLEYDPKTDKAVDTGILPAIPIDMSDVEVTNAKTVSHDGALIPIVVMHKKGLKLSGANPTLMTGYGAYGQLGTPPFYSAYLLPWLERGGIYVLTGVRGGGEYGEEWHEAGKGATKPNTWKDFIACAEYLIEKKYSSAEHLGIEGTSAGGILISNAVAARPELFAAAIINVGINNSLRFETTATGAANVPEFGSVKTKEGFKNLLAMDGYLKIRDGVQYPAVLLTHGINDPRVAPWMSAKMAARLQAASSSGKPVLLRIDYDAGHGIGSSQQQTNELRADQFAFLFEQLGGGKSK